MKRFAAKFGAVIMSLGILVPTLSNGVIINAETETGSITVTVYDAETGFLFTDEDSSFDIVGSVASSIGAAGAIYVGGWKPGESNPHTISDIENTGVNWNYAIQHSGRDNDGFTYHIDWDKSKTTFDFTDGLNQTADIYMKKYYWRTDAESFDAKEFFVYVGTYGNDELPQFRYIYPKDGGGYNADKVIWKNAPKDLCYGDIFTADTQLTLTKVKPAENDPANANVYYYTIDESDELLHKVGNCLSLMEQKDLTVTSISYDGSSHWSIRYKDDADTEYYYGLSVFGSALTVNPIDCEIGDVYTCAMYDGNIVIPIFKQDKSISYGIGVSQPPNKVVYQIGQELDLSGLHLNGSYIEGERVASIMNEDYQKLLDSHAPIIIDSSEFDSSKTGTYQIYVHYGNTKDSFTVIVTGDKTALNGTKQMTLNDVKKLAEKGDKLDWSDFNGYKGNDMGSGIHIWKFKLEEGYSLSVEGSYTTEKPERIRLYCSNETESIDIRTDSVDEYLLMTTVNTMTVQITEITGSTLLVRPVNSSDSNDLYSLSSEHLDKSIVPTVGMKLEVTYSGGILESYPAQFGKIKKVSVISEVSTIMGDANCDGEFNISDVVVFQKWLLAATNTNLKNWQVIDFCYDECLDVFDLCLMKRALLEKANASVEIDIFGLTPTQSGVDEFLAQYSVSQSEYEDDELYNITPQEITDKYGLRIFKYSKNCETFLEYNGNLYTLGIGFGGNGTTSFAVADLNNDGNIEIYFTYSWGSGMHHAQVGYFDTATLKGIDFDYTGWYDLALALNNGQLEVYTADLHGNSFVDMIATPKDKVGEIEVENGVIVFNSISNQTLDSIKSIDSDDIESVTLSANSPNVSVELTREQIDEMLTLLKDVKLYEEDNSYNEYNGQWIQFDISQKSGEETSIAVYNPFIIIDRKGYIAEYEPCQALNVFANSILT